MTEQYLIPSRIAYKKVDQLRSEGIKKVGIGLFIVDLDTKKYGRFWKKKKKLQHKEK